MLYFFISCLLLYVLFFFVSLLFPKLKGVEVKPMSDNNAPERLKRVEEKPMSDNNPPQTKYDVFVSFRGKDIRDGFLSHLIEAFERKKIYAFVDDKLERGHEIWPSLVRAIERSSISLIIFSPDYAFSRWCLEEVVKILECREKYERIVIPVFYKVKPKNVRHQSASYENAFVEHGLNYKTKVQIWIDALKESGDLSGIESSKFLNDAELVKEIVNLVMKRLVKPLVNSKELVGIDEKIATIESWIRKESKDTRLIGIWGMGGMGKTTLAEEVFNKLQFEYEGCYFLAHEREESNKHAIISLKERIFSGLLGYGVKIYTLNSLPRDIVRRIGCMKVLIVLDDVNDPDHIKNLLGTLDNFGSGSRIIVTTRNEQVLKTNKADETYQLTKLSFDEALELFNLIFFNQSDNQREYNELSGRVVHYAQGIPLVLKVLGGHLRGNKKEVWESELDKLKKMPHTKVYDVMIWSFYDLDRKQQQIFLDLACFFLRSQNAINVSDLKFLLKDSERDNSVVADLERLKDKALITFSMDGFVSMHDTLQEMAWEIVRRESIEDPGSRSRLWDPDDIYKALKDGKVTEAIRSMRIDLPTIKELKLIPHIFAKMSRLQFLEIFEDYDYECLDQFHILAEGLQFLATELRFLGWLGCPLKSLPENFSAEKLVILKLPYGNLEKLWDGVKNLMNLIEVDLSGSKKLKELPDLSKATNLEVLDLGDCSMLTCVHPSIFSLAKLEKLDLWGCESLTILASDSHLCSLTFLDLDYCKNLTEFSVISKNMEDLRLASTKVKALPSSFGLQSKLKLLDLTGSDIERLPSSFENLTQLLHLKVSETSLQTITELPPFLETLNATLCTSLQTLSKLPLSLETLNVQSCKSLQTLPELPPSLKTLNVESCESLQTLPELPPYLETLNVNLFISLQTIPKLPLSLITLEATCCSLLKTLPELPPSLETLNVESCASLQTLPKLPRSLETLDVKCCSSLQTLPELPSFLKNLYATDCRSLKTVLLFPTTTVEQLKENRTQVLFWNCLNLDEHSLIAIGFYAQINVMKFANHHLSTLNQNHCENYYHYDCGDNHHSYQAIYVYPGSGVPEWLKYKTTKDYIIIDLSSAPSSPQLGFIFCFVLGKYQDPEIFLRLEVNLVISDGDGEGKKDSVRMYSSYLDSIIESDHVCVMYDQRCSAFLNSRAKNQTRFKIEVTVGEQRCPRTHTLPQHGLKGFGVGPISSSAYNSFIQQMELGCASYHLRTSLKK